MPSNRHVALWKSGHEQECSEELRSVVRGKDVYLYCPGPSLADVDVANLTGPNVIVAALNTAYPRIRPDLWMGMDVPQCYDRGLWFEPFAKIIRRRRFDRLVTGIEVGELPMVYGCDVTDGKLVDWFDAPGRVRWEKSTFASALQILDGLEAARIHLVGCDFGGKRDYYDDRQLPSDQHRSNRSLYRRLCNDLRAWSVEFAKRGVEIVSCTPDSPCNDYLRFVPLADALKQSKGRIHLEGEIVHSSEAKACAYRERFCQWPARPALPRGVLLVVDKTFQWLLPLWWQKYIAHNDLPVAFADVGMTKDMVQWCKARGAVLNVPREVRPDAEFRTLGVKTGCKPICMLQTPFDLTLYLDVDCFVYGDVGPALDHVGERDLAIAVDTLWNTIPENRRPKLNPNEVMHNAGVIAYRRGSPLVLDYALAVTRRITEGRQSDQPILSKVLHEHEGKWGVLPAAMNAMDPGSRRPDGCVIWHRLTSHPLTVKRLQREANAMYSLGPAWCKVAVSDDWKSGIVATEGVIVGCEISQEWMLDWWWQHYRRHNDYPVVFTDFGMSAEAKEWCKAHGLLTQPILLEGHPWFRKPLACARSPFAASIWLDMDCQVNGPLGPIMQSSRGGKVGVTIDRGTPQRYIQELPMGAKMYNSGCVAFRHSDPAISHWAMMARFLPGHGGEHNGVKIPAGDQEMLAMALYHHGSVCELPTSVVTLRLGELDMRSPGLVRHWTGTKGKEVIKVGMRLGQTILASDRKELMSMLPKGGVGREVGVYAGDGTMLESKAPGLMNLPDASLDWAMIDGDHSEEAALRDMLAVAAKIKPHGVILAHDYTHKHKYGDAVARAIVRFCHQSGWVLLGVTGEQNYQTALLARDGFQWGNLEVPLK